MRIELVKAVDFDPVVAFSELSQENFRTSATKRVYNLEIAQLDIFSFIPQLSHRCCTFLVEPDTRYLVPMLWTLSLLRSLTSDSICSYKVSFLYRLAICWEFVLILWTGHILRSKVHLAHPITDGSWFSIEVEVILFVFFLFCTPKGGLLCYDLNLFWFFFLLLDDCG